MAFYNNHHYFYPDRVRWKIKIIYLDVSKKETVSQLRLQITIFLLLQIKKNKFNLNFIGFWDLKLTLTFFSYRKAQATQRFKIQTNLRAIQV